MGVERSDHCRWHPPALWVGMGCERNTSLELLERGLNEALAAQGLALEAVAGLASADRKANEPALLELAERHGWPLRCFSSSALHAVEVPNPSPVVEAELGTASVAEAAALLAWGPTPACGFKSTSSGLPLVSKALPRWPSPRPLSSGRPSAAPCT